MIDNVIGFMAPRVERWLSCHPEQLVDKPTEREMQMIAEARRREPTLHANQTDQEMANDFRAIRTIDKKKTK